MDKIISGGETIDIPKGKTVQIIAAIVPGHIKADGFDLQVCCKGSNRIGYVDCIHLKDKENISVPDANHVVLNKVVYDKKISPLETFSIRLAEHEEIGEYQENVKAVYRFVNVPLN